MDIIIKIIQVIFALSILVLVHELGHFVFARIFKIRVDKFYLFFDAGFALFRYKPKNSDTEYGIGWLPLGGYCKISGMIDESLDTNSLSEPPKDYEFRSKPAWQRLLVMAGGVLFNLIFAVFLYCAIMFTWGDEYLKNDDATFGIAVNSVSYDMGFRNGDKIIAFDESKPEKFHELQIDLVRLQAEKATVLRDGKTITLNINPIFLPAAINTPGMFELAYPFEIGEIPENSINLGSGIMSGDKIIGINEQPMFLAQDIQTELKRHKGETILLNLIRSEEELSINVAVDTTGLLQVHLSNPAQYFHFTQHKYNILSAIPAGFKLTVKTVGNYLKDLGLIFSPKTEAYKSVGSVIAIGSIFPSIWNWEFFWKITAMLSIMLAVINLLPIPALDGGHIVFTIYEIITRRKPSDKFLEIAQITGMIILLVILILAFGNDIVRLFK